MGKSRSAGTVESNVVRVELGEIKNSCFVAMPLDSLYQAHYEDVIKPALHALGLECIRGDETYTNQRIMTELWREIRACRFVLAELSGRNPNVLYEVGLAHAIGKPVISITRTKEDVPFDVRDLRYFFYDVNHPKWGETLQNALTRMASAIIKDPAFGDYLEGIRSEGRMVLPKALPKERIQSRPKNTQRSDISGTWTGTYTDENRVSHSLALELVQSENSVKGFALVTYSVGAVKTTVQEDLKGFVNEREVSIQGVGYSYLERGASVNYVLDNFTLKLKENNKSMKGHAMYGNHPYPVEFIKQR